MATWTKEEIAAMAIADAEIDEDFCMTREEFATSRELDDVALESRLTDREVKRKRFNREYNRRYYQQHKSELLARNAAYREANRKQISETCAAWHERNAEYEKIWQKAYYEENCEIILVKKQIQHAINRSLRRLTETGEEEA